MRCPIDGTPLEIIERSGIEIDYCPKCKGVWLDRGELDKLIDLEAAAFDAYADFDSDPSVLTKRKNDEAPAARTPRPQAPPPDRPSPPRRRWDDDDDDDDEKPLARRIGRSLLGEIFDFFD